jgi:5-methylcytosine-specific restriction endonuclease McrA
MGNLLWRTFVRGLHNVLGLDSPYSQQEYGKNWSKQQRRCRERDSHECRVCEATQDEIGRALSVHHITPRSEFDDSEWRQYNDLENLVCLCPSCHGTFEGRFIDEDVEDFVSRAREANA